ncbi:hypothetical protein ABK040_002302 [Willaertia magna]
MISNDKEGNNNCCCEIEEIFDEDFGLNNEEVFAMGTEYNNEANEYFYTIVGALEETIMEDEFTALIDSFAEKYCEVFVEGDENKLEYTTIFNEYQQIIEKYLDQSLHNKIEGYDMNQFISILEKIESKKKQDNNRSDFDNDFSGEVFDMLLSFTDFVEFKELMLSYKKKDYFNDKFDGLLVVDVCKQ